MLLVIDVGNTNITLGIFRGEELLGTFRMTTKLPRTSDEYGITLRELVERHGISSTEINAVIVAFVINYACYFSEIYRGGIESVSRGQYEAAQVLGMTKAQTFFRIILPQVVKRIVPPMSNEIITLVKDTSLARIISVGEIIFSAQTLVNHYAVIWPLFYAGAFYLIFNGILTLLFRYIEKKLDYYKV